MQQGSSSDRAWWRHDASLGWAMFVVLGLLVGVPFIVGYMFVQMLQPPSAKNAVMAGGRIRILVVWSPTIADEPNEEIIVFHTNQIGSPELSRRATRSPRQQGAPMSAFTMTRLTLEQWQALDHLRERWCANPPTFDTLSWFSQEPFYDVGLNCSTSRELIYQQVKVPPDSLPPELIMLLEVIPSGQDREDDPYRGLLHPSSFSFPP